MQSNWQHLPHSILGLILVHLYLPDKLFTACVCKWWRQCVRTEPSAWRCLSLFMAETEKAVDQQGFINLISPGLMSPDSRHVAAHQEVLPLTLTDRHVELLIWLLAHWGKLPVLRSWLSNW